MTSEMTLATTFDGLSDDAWNGLAGEHFYSTADWQRYCTAETQTDGGAIVTRGADGVQWAAPVRELAGLAEWSSYRWNDHLARAGLPRLAGEGLLVGPPEGFQTHLLAGADRDPGTLAGFVDAVRERCGAGERSAVAMFLSTADAVLLRAAGIEHVPVLLETDAWLAVPEGGWDGYLATFPRKRRRNIRTERTELDEARLTVTHRALAECWSALGPAAASLLHKYGHDTTPETELVSIRRAVDILGPQARVAICHDVDSPDDPIGFCIYYERAHTVFIRWVGFDNDRLRGAKEYFNTLFYTQIQRAESVGTRWIHGGATTPAAKALRGAQLRPLWLVDLTANSPLTTAGPAIRQHNTAMLDDLKSDPRTSEALAPAGEWTAFT